MKNKIKMLTIKCLIAKLLEMDSEEKRTLHELNDDVQSVDNGDYVLCVDSPVISRHSKGNVVGRSEARVDDELLLNIYLELPYIKLAPLGLDLFQEPILFYYSL